ncbi:MAG: GGDEF domain-containing protein [Acidobacteria bacterium]|nr:MAG: GGDEF domain-containing protein [Acidobacteriota bacterium]
MSSGSSDMSQAEPDPGRDSWRGTAFKVSREAFVVWRRDGWLIVGLILAALIVFEASVRRIFQVAHQAEVAYGLALLPALFILTAILLFQQYVKRQEAKTEAAAAAAEAAQVRERLLELERLAGLGHSLAGCLNFDALQQVVWKHLPRLVGRHDAWVLTYHDGVWQVLADTSGEGADRLEVLQRHAAHTLSQPPDTWLRPEGTEHEGTVCFPMTVGDKTIGVAGLAGAPPAGRERRLMAAAASLLAMAVRNVQLFLDTRDNALHDGLTGCVTRAHGLEVLGRELDRVARKPIPVSILMFDVDGFKLMNDRYGHLVGDEVLTAVGQRIRQVLRRSDTKCRYGGDEFLVILPETPAEGAVHVAEWLRQEFAKLRVPRVAGEPLTVSASFGAVTTEKFVDAKELVGRADLALYEAKRDGRDCVRSYDPHMATTERRLSVVDGAAS